MLIIAQHTDQETGIVCINLFGNLKTGTDLYLVVFGELIKCTVRQNICGKHSCKEKRVVYFVISANVDPVLNHRSCGS